MFSGNGSFVSCNLFDFLISLYGFGHTLSFIKITKEHIDGAEKFIRENVYDHLTRSTIEALNESGQDISMNDENVLISDDQMVKHFGKLYATQPQNFRFEVGERILIEELVEHLKDIVASQGKKGLKIFKCQKHNKGKNLSSMSSISEYNHDELKLQLLKRVIFCLRSYEAEQFFDTDLDSIIKENAVDVRIKKGVGVYGSVRCAICDVNGKKNNKPKRVHFSTNSKWPCWVLANFKKHLTNVHNLQYNEICKSKQEQKLEEIEYVPVNSSNTSIHEDDSVQIVCEDGKIFEADSEWNDDIEINMFAQLSVQINLVLAATLQYSEEQESMTFFIDDIDHNLEVAIFKADGNCLFSSISHQLYRLNTNSKAHTTKTAELRARTVRYILEPDNFPNFAYQLQNCVFEIMKKEDIKDMATECKLYVKLVLAKKGQWGGAESIKAISEIEEVNIIIFNENGPCYMLSNVNKKYQRSIAIAYRLASMGETRNHYDSVCDIDANLLNLISQELKKVRNK